MNQQCRLFAEPFVVQFSTMRFPLIDRLAPIVAAACGLSAAEPLFETTGVFPLTPENKPNYRIPAILQAPNGDVLVFAEKRNDGPGDIGNHDIVLKRSRDLGKTWNDEQAIFDADKRVCTDLTVRLSYDEGATWTAGKTIWPHPASYSDMVLLADDTIAYVYERGAKGTTHYWDEIQLARFNLEWLTDGRTC